MAQEVELFHCERWGPLYPTCLISWLLMAWWHREPGHQQSWYWPCSQSRNNLVSASKGLIEKNYDNYMKIITMIMKEFLLFFNLLWPSDNVWWHRSGSDLAQIMAWWLVISVVLWYSLEGNFTGKAPRYLSLIWTEKHQCWFYYTSASKTNISFDFRLS